MDEELARRVGYLEDRLSIQDLRHRYWLAIVERDLETMLGCYAEDAHSQFGVGMDFKGLHDLRSFYEKQMSNPELAAQIPFGTNGLVKVIDETHASGSWLISVVIVKHNEERGTRTNVRYHEEYRKIDGIWKISSQIVDYLCQEEIKPM